MKHELSLSTGTFYDLIACKYIWFDWFSFWRNADLFFSNLLIDNGHLLQITWGFVIIIHTYLLSNWEKGNSCDLIRLAF